LAGIADDRYVENANDIHLEPRLTEIFLAATHSSSFPLRISHGQSRAVRNAASQPRPSAKSSRFPVRRESRIVELSASIVFRINPHFRTRTTTPHIHISTYPHTHIYYRKSDLITIHGSRRSRPYSKGWTGLIWCFGFVSVLRGRDYDTCEVSYLGWKLYHTTYYMLHIACHVQIVFIGNCLIASGVSLWFLSIATVFTTTLNMKKGSINLLTQPSIDDGPPQQWINWYLPRGHTGNCDIWYMVG
jgi:hypothetical protein